MTEVAKSLSLTAFAGTRDRLWSEVWKAIRVRVLLLTFLLPLGCPSQAARVVVDSVEIWNGSSNPHAAEGVLLSGSGTWDFPFEYIIPDGMTITNRGAVRLSAAANFRFVFQNEGLDIPGNGLLDLNKGGDRLSLYLCTLDLGGHDITGMGRIDSSATGAQGLEIINANNIGLSVINLQRSDTASASVSISAMGKVVITGGVNTSDTSAGGNRGGNVNIRASQIEIGPIKTGASRAASPTQNGDVQLLALAPPDYSSRNVFSNSVANRLTLLGGIDTSGALPETTDGNVYLGAVQMILAPAFSLTTPQGVFVQTRTGVAQEGYSHMDLFQDSVPGGSGLEVQHSVLWSSPNFRVVSTVPADGADLVLPPEEILVHFSNEPDSSTVDPQDLLVDGTPSTAMAFESDTAISFASPALSATASVHTIGLAAGSIQSASGIPLDGYTGSFRTLVAPTIEDQQILAVGAHSVRLAATVSQTPRITVYYGAADGEDQAEEWEHSRGFGAFPDGLAEFTLAGLAPSTDYYFRAKVENELGESWASESLHITTLTEEPPKDSSTVAMWLFDETDYSYTTLLDAATGEFDLRLDQQGELGPGRFGNAVRNRPGEGFSVHASVWSGIPPAALWGPNLIPESLLRTLADSDWTLEFWLRLAGIPQADSAVLHLGEAYEAGFELDLVPSQDAFRIINSYMGDIHACMTDLDGLADGEWHHVAFVLDRTLGKLQHFVDGNLQPAAVISATGTEPLPPRVIPPSLTGDVTGIFNGTRDYETFRQNRFNFSIGEDRHGDRDLDASFDEIRFSDIPRYSGPFDPPDSFSNNYGDLPPPSSIASGPPPLFDNPPCLGPFELGSRKHVFIDDALIAEKENVALTVNPPFDPQPTNINFGGDFCAVDHEGTIYMIVPDGYSSDKGITRLYTSNDGIHFNTPDLGVVEVNGSSHNNVILQLTPTWCGVFKDPNPEVPPEEHFKMTAWVANKGIVLYTSPDLIRWRRNETLMLPLVCGGGCETFWDDQFGVYRNFLKRDPNMEGVGCLPPGGRVATGFVATEPFKTWPFNPVEPPVFTGWALPSVSCEGPTSFPVNERGEVYRTRAIKYLWAPDTYLAFIWRFDPDQIRRTELATSRDGINWVELGHLGYYMGSNGSLGSGDILERKAQYGLVRRGNEIWQYTEDDTGAHGSGQRRCFRTRQRLDGFTSLDAGESVGRLLTRPFTFQGRRLALNIQANEPARVGFLDENGNPIPGFSLSDCDPIQTDHVNHQVSWKGEPSVRPLQGQVVQMEFELRETKLFAFEFIEDASSLWLIH